MFNIRMLTRIMISRAEALRAAVSCNFDPDRERHRHG